MKKITVILMCLILCFSFIGCDDTEKQSEDNKTESSSNSSLSSSIASSPTPSLDSSLTSSKDKNTSGQNSHIPTFEELSDTDKLRPDYNLGDCKKLQGDVKVVLFYFNDFESRWTIDEILNFTENEIKPALTFLENSAKKFNIDLNLEIVETNPLIYYSGEVQVDMKTTGYVTVDTVYVGAKHLGYSNEYDLMSAYKRKYSSEIIFFSIFNKNGTAYALNPQRDSEYDVLEHVLLFAYDLHPSENVPVGAQSSVVAHETLHLYGAEDYYKPDSRKALAKKHCPTDIMLTCDFYLWKNTFGKETAFYIGWTDEVPQLLHEEKW